jgi:hypothetical protein
MTPRTHSLTQGSECALSEERVREIMREEIAKIDGVEIRDGKAGVVRFASEGGDND